MQIARLIAVESDHDFIWSAFSNAYQEVVECQFDAWEGKLQKSVFDEKWHQGGFEVLQLNGTSVGAVWVTSEGGFLQLREIFLAPEYQRRGIGSQVVR
ncbi:GNAT family N-acetyltransferase [Halomonas aquamarina]|uniref:GNAT family N-acetyltransferase n=1 Tax=Vreelandella aquamarina TaxID=77097 RepID=A0ACC5VYY5_9GAMM|nr:GNAT family N-acetyltransferase [Halomonas aquamarina]MBZ5488959.1 GNAT family N-acetyltransferase [Halomonas aquamarina]